MGNKSILMKKKPGRPPKYINGGELKYMQKIVPVKAYKEISDAFDKMIKEQFADRDWT